MQIKIIVESQEQHVNTIHGSITPTAFSIAVKARLPILAPSRIAWIVKEQQLAHFVQHVPLSHLNISSIQPTVSAQLAQ